MHQPPPINYTTHPRYTALTCRGTQAASVALAAPTIVTGAVTATSSSVDGHDCIGDLFGEAFSTNDVNPSQVTQSPAVPPAPVRVIQRCYGKDMYYSVTVGKCCGVYFSW